MPRAIWIRVLKSMLFQRESQSTEQLWLPRNLVTCHPVGTEMEHVFTHVHEDVSRTASAAKVRLSKLRTSVLATHRPCHFNHVAHLAGGK